jgi:hypothetical protein
MDIIHRESTFLDPKLKEVDHGIEPTFFDVRVFAEVIIGVK